MEPRLTAARSTPTRVLVQEQIEQLEMFLDTLTETKDGLVTKPGTRVQACQLLSKAKEMQRQVNSYKLPDLDAEYTEEEGDRLDVALDRYNELRQELADIQAKAETLCVCWDRLDADVSELTAALTNGGAGKITMDRLEASIKALKEMFTERRNIIEDLAPAAEL